ncbi:unnamed protein product [Protopolystoma xenopodis]|uniref:Uncharacterized protein n=1 Tax=Protopolystoma xenopodis TaxID=117903 RepID=A0A448WPQ5_9PLAT|nr:unnamed protein product [Protopolystoma xenopodis]
MRQASVWPSPCLRTGRPDRLFCIYPSTLVSSAVRPIRYGLTAGIACQAVLTRQHWPPAPMAGQALESRTEQPLGTK